MRITAIQGAERRRLAAVSIKVSDIRDGDVAAAGDAVEQLKATSTSVSS